VWKTVDFPQAKKGWAWVIGTNAVLIPWTFLIQTLLVRDRRKAQHRRDIDSADEVVEDVDGKASPSLDSPEPTVIRALA